MESLIEKITHFKNKYFTNNFYWITAENYEQIQLIGIEFGCMNPNGEPSIIKWHDGFKNLGFRTYETNKGVTKFQKEAFLVHNEEATNYNEMLKDYKALNEFIKEYKVVENERELKEAREKYRKNEISFNELDRIFDRCASEIEMAVFWKVPTFDRPAVIEGKSQKQRDKEFNDLIQ